MNFIHLVRQYRQAIMSLCIFAVVIASLAPRIFSGSEVVFASIATLFALLALTAYFSSLENDRKSTGGDKLVSSSAVLIANQQLIFQDYGFANALFAHSVMTHRSHHADKDTKLKIPQSERLRRLLVTLGTDDFNEPLDVNVGAVTIRMSDDDTKVFFSLTKPDKLEGRVNPVLSDAREPEVRLN